MTTAPHTTDPPPSPWWTAATSGTRRETLDRRRCLEHLAQAGTGWLTYLQPSRPTTAAVHYRVSGDVLVLTACSGPDQDALVAAPLVLVRVEHVDPDLGSGWMVVTVGRLAPSAAHRGPAPGAAGPASPHLTLDLAGLSGRAVHVTAPGAAGSPADAQVTGASAGEHEAAFVVHAAAERAAQRARTAVEQAAGRAAEAAATARAQRAAAVQTAAAGVASQVAATAAEVQSQAVTAASTVARAALEAACVIAATVPPGSERDAALTATLVAAAVARTAVQAAVVTAAARVEVAREAVVAAATAADAAADAATIVDLEVMTAADTVRAAAVAAATTMAEHTSASAAALANGRG